MKNKKIKTVEFNTSKLFSIPNAWEARWAVNKEFWTTAEKRVKSPSHRRAMGVVLKAAQIVTKNC